VDAPHLTSEEENVVGAIAALEAGGQTSSLAAVADRAGLSVEATRAVLSRLLGELGLVQELEGDELGPYYVLSGRAGAETGGAQTGALQSEGVAEQLERSLGDLAFPATTEMAIARAVDGGLPQPLVQAVRRLPEGAIFLSLQDLVEAVNQQHFG
jgi:hypothetical protein